MHAIALHAVRRVVGIIRNGHHGGTLLILPPQGADSLAVWDPAKGVVAVVPLAALKASPKLLEEDFLFYDTVTVRLQGRNGAPASGIVRLKDRQRQQGHGRAQTE